MNAKPKFVPTPRYNVFEKEFWNRMQKAPEHYRVPKFFFSWRLITNATNERTVIAAILPVVAVSNSLPTMFFGQDVEPSQIAGITANFSSFVFDYFARQKIGGTNLTLGLIKQLPVFSPSQYSKSDQLFIVARVLELTYTADDMKYWANFLGYEGTPFKFDPHRRAQLRAELDAWYAKAYGLSRDELRYILDPADVMGDDYPSETFRVLKNNEIKEFGEYRTRRLVLEAWDKLENGELSS